MWSSQGSVSPGTWKRREFSFGVRIVRFLAVGRGGVEDVARCRLVGSWLGLGEKVYADRRSCRGFGGRAMGDGSSQIDRVLEQWNVCVRECCVVPFYSPSLRCVVCFGSDCLLVSARTSGGGSGE